MRKSMTAARRQVARNIGDMLVADRDTYEHQVAASRKARFITGADVLYERMKEFIERDDYRIEIPTDDHLQSELHWTSAIP